MSFINLKTIILATYDGRMKKIALVTGASQGIGAAITQSFVKANFTVLAVARRRRHLETLQKQTGSKAVEIYPCDVSSAVAVAKFVREIESRFSHVDVLVNGAGAGYFEPILKTSLTHWQTTLATNLTGLFLMTKALIPMLTRSGRGHIINICSSASKKGFPNCGAYAASKFGALGFTDVLREEMRARRIKVTAIIPGAVDTPFWEAQEGEFDRTQMLSAEDVAHAVQYACSQSENNLVEEIVLKPSRGDF
jgi:short-subunit dehydrogenase